VSAVFLLLRADFSGAAAVPDVLGGGRLVSYTPRSWGVPHPGALRVDAVELRRHGFRAITTPATARLAGPVCRLFKRHGFHLVLLDVADPRDREALGRARRLWRCADGYVVGNGGLAAGRYDRAVLETAMTRLRGATGRPVTTREPVAQYTRDPGLLALGEWVFPSANPYDADARPPQTACGLSVRWYFELLDRVGPGRPIVLGETGLPTAGERPLSENGQRAFLACIEVRGVRFEHHTAFDDPGRTGSPAAADWGLFRADGTPKAWAISVAPPRIAMRVRPGRVRGVVGNAAPEHFRIALYVHGERWQSRGLVDISRRGKWKVRGAAAAALLVSRAFVPAAAADRLPQVDGATVFAVATVAARGATWYPLCFAPER